MSTCRVREEYEFENCTQRRLGLLFAGAGAAAGFAFGSSFAATFFVAVFPLLPALGIRVPTAAVSSASATLGTFSRLRFLSSSAEGWKRGRVLGRCATYELVQYLLLAILACVRGMHPLLVLPLGVIIIIALFFRLSTWECPL